MVLKMGFFPAFTLSILNVLLLFASPTQAKLSAECTFAEMKLVKTSQNVTAQPLKFSGELPSTRNLSHSCLVKTNDTNRLMYLRAKTNEWSIEGSLHVSAYEEGEGPLLINHLGISTSEAGWRSCPFCPTRGRVSGKQLLFSGTNGVSFEAEMQHQGGIQLDEPVEAKLSAKDSYPAVYQFTPTKDISSTQLDVTVTSESDDVPAYLKVSRVCEDVKDNIDVVDYKGKSLRLSFTKKGRITLSKFSIPPLTASTSSWFIGIAIKNASGDTLTNATKTVTLTLSRSFDYSYKKPLLLLFLGCILIGVFISFLTWLIFREYRFCGCNQGDEIKKIIRAFFSAMLAVICSHSLSQGPKTFSYITLIVGWVLMVGSFQFVFADWHLMSFEGDRDHCYYNDFCYRVCYADIPCNLILSNLAYVLLGLILAGNVLCMESAVFARCREIAKTPDKNRKDRLSDQGNTCKDQNIPNASEKQGERKDPKNTNECVIGEELPDHVLRCPDISLHLGEMFVPTDVIEDNHRLNNLLAKALKKRFDFSIGYAFAWALYFEGMFSALYHLCPSKLAFQFDTAFMFVMASLNFVLMYNGIETKPCKYVVDAKRRVGAANFFLFFLVPLFISNYLGTMYHSVAGMATAIKVLFLSCLALWVIILAVWAGYRLCPQKCIECCKCCLSEDLKKSNEKAYETYPEENAGFKCVLFWSCCVIGFAVIPVVLIFLLIYDKIEFTDAFLYFCLTESAVVVARSFLTSKWFTVCSNRSCVRIFFQILFGGSIMVIIGYALYIFFEEETTDKSKSPEESRDLNKECTWFDFFDDHDQWHILSSFGLFMGALMLIHASYKSPNVSSQLCQKSPTGTKNRGYDSEDAEARPGPSGMSPETHQKTDENPV